MLRYRGLGYVSLNVTDLRRSREFYEGALGLQFDGEGPEGELFFGAGGEHQGVVLCRGDKPGLKRIGWELESEAQLDLLAQTLDRCGVRWRELSPQACRSIRVERCIRMEEANTGASFDFLSGFVTRALAPREATISKIRRLGHIVLRTPRYREAAKFFEEALNFRTSDEIEDRITLLRCFPNPFHHSLGIANAERNMLHHVNFMLSETGDMNAAADRFRKSGVPIVCGPGLHPPSGSVFLYFLDPDGLTLEYSQSMERFEEVAPRAPRVLPPVPESSDALGNERDPRMGAIGEIETLSAGT
ncbi:MAG TPA: VOC family protein [Burkholderiales bacterium]